VSLEPLLKESEDLICAKAHLAEPVKLNFPHHTELGCGWEEAFISPGVLYQTVVVWIRQWCAPLHCLTCIAWSSCSLFRQVTAGPHGRRESVRGRWARAEYDQLQPTAPGLVFPLLGLAMAQAASCGVRETQLQVRDRLTFHCTVYSVQCVQPQPGAAQSGAPSLCPLRGAQDLVCPVAAGRLVRGDR
jgi:hypothetical protein